MINGRSAWTSIGHSNGSSIYEYIEGKPQDGSEASKGIQYKEVNLGIQAIQKGINDLGFTPKLVTDGVFGQKTQAGVKFVQGVFNITVDGKAGQGTCSKLWRQYVSAAMNAQSLPSKYLFGQILMESAADPSAEGFSNSEDKGLVQINLPANPGITLEQAYDPKFSTQYSAGRLRDAYDKYSGKGMDLRIKAMILQHNTPFGAYKLYVTGDYPSPAAQKYVETTLGYTNLW